MSSGSGRRLEDILQAMSPNAAFNTRRRTVNESESVLPRNPRFETYQDKAGEWRWRLRAANGLIVADSAESYAKKANALRAATAVRALLRWDEFPVPIFHWEPGQKDVGGNPGKVRSGKEHK